MKYSSIHELYIGVAHYYLNDKSGNSLIMKVDYRSALYKITTICKNGVGYDQLVREASEMANDLLQRKSNINLITRNS